MRVRLLQYAAAQDADANLATVARLLDEPDESADLVVLPEAAMHDFGPPDLPLGPVAQSLDGSFITGIGELARKYETTIIAGMFETSDDADRPYNTLAVVDQTGAVTATYRKIHLYDSFGYRESDRMLAGSVQPVVVPIANFTVGLLTCYDLRFPEHTRALVDAGADMVALPAAWLAGPLKEDHWTTLVRARAIENTVYVAAAEQHGSSYCGRSMVVDPLGVVIAGAGSDEAVVTATVTQERLAQARDRNPSLTHRRITAVSTPAAGA